MRIYDASGIELARENVARHETARAVADGVMREADRWVGRSEAFVVDRMPDGRVPRTFLVNHVTGCPVHGADTAMCGAYGVDNWSVDVMGDEPWRVKCAAGGEIYPSNDFEAFHRSGLTDRSLLTGDFADDGHGWLGEGARYRHWFVAFAADQMWKASLSGVEALSRAYVLSGEDRYARQALVMLGRAADVYAGMDYEHSMYGTEFSPGYSGKIDYQISEARVVYRLARAFDLVRDAATAAACKHIESGLVREMMRGVYEEHTRGNYGMHQVALMASALVLGDADELAEAVEWTLNQSGEASRLKEMRMLVDGYVFRDRAAHAEGLKWAWDNLMFREGIGWESSPSYCGSWVAELYELAALLERGGQPIWDEPKLRRMLVWPVEMSHFGLSTPAIGDAGSVKTFVQRISGRVLRLAFEKYRDPLAARQMLDRGLFGEGLFDQFDDLMRPGADEGALRAVAGGDDIGRLRDRSRLMGGYGLAMLRAGQGEDGVAASVYFGRAATEHGHFDRLNLELFGYGRRLLPELGYPIHAAEGSEPGVWTKNTSAHATVMVDERRQSNQAAGRVCAFVTGARTQYAEIDAAGTYDQTSEYRRAVVMATVGGAGGQAQQHYVIDLFRVTGGRRHDYSLHGFDAPFSVAGLDLSEAGRGTLAGEDVAYGSAYDDADLDRPDCVRSYYTYAGSGYSYLRDVRRGRPGGAWSATWDDGETGVRVHGLPDEGDEVIVAEGAYPEKQAERHYLKFVVQRRDGDPASSCFASVIEPYRGEPFIGSVTDESAEGVRRICVEHRLGRDTWTLNPGVDGARVVRVARNESGQLVGVDVIGCGQMQEAGCAVRVTGGVTGRITRVDDGAHEIEVALEGEGLPDECVKSMAGQTAIIGNPRHGTTYTVVEARREAGKLIVRFGDESFRIGRLKVGSVSGDGGTIVTPTYLYLAHQGYYRGTHLVNEAGDAWHELDDVVLSPHRPGCRRDGRVTLRDPGGGDLARRLGTEASIYDLGPGDRFEIVPHVQVERGEDGEWAAEGFGQYDVG